MKLVLFSSSDVYLHRPIEFEVPLDGCRSYFSLHHTIRQKIVALKRSAPDIRRVSGNYKGALEDEFGSSNIARAQTFPDPYGGVDVGSYTLFEVDGARLTTHASIFTRISAGSSRHHHKEKLMLIVSDSESLPLAVGGLQTKGTTSSRVVAPRRDDRAERLLSLSAAHRRQSAYDSVETSSDSSPTSSTNSSTTQSTTASSPQTPPQVHRRASFKPSDSGRSTKSTTATADQYMPPSPVLASSGGGSPGYLNSHHREPLPPFRYGQHDHPAQPITTATKGLNSSIRSSAVAGQLTYETSDADGDAPPTPRSSLYAPSSRAAASHPHYAPPSSIGRNTSTGMAPSSRLQLSSALEGLTGREQRDINRHIPEGLHVATKSAVFYFNTNSKEHDHHINNKGSRGVSHSNTRSATVHGDSSRASSTRQSEVGLVQPPSRLLLADYRGGRVPQYTPVHSSPPSRRSPPRGPKQGVVAAPEQTVQIAYDPSRLQGTPQRSMIAPTPPPQPEAELEDEDVAFADEVSDEEEMVVPPTPPADPRYHSVESSASVSLIGGAHTETRSAHVINRSIMPPPMDDDEPTTPISSYRPHQQTSPSPLPSSHASDHSDSVPHTHTATTGAVVVSRRASNTTVSTSRRQPIMAPSPTTVSSAPQLNNAPTFYNTPNINITIRMPSPGANNRQDQDRSIRVDTSHTDHNNNVSMAPPIGGGGYPTYQSGRYQDPMGISIDRGGNNNTTTTTNNNNSRRWAASIEDEDAVVYNSQDVASYRRHLVSPPSAHVETAPIPPTPQSAYVDVTPYSPPRVLDAASLHHPHDCSLVHSPSGMAQLRSPVETASSPVQATGGGGVIRSPSAPITEAVPDPVPVVLEDKASLDVSKVTGTTNGPSTPFNLTGEPVGPKGIPIVKSIPPVTPSTPQDSAAEEREDAQMLAALPPVFKHTPYQRRPTPQRSTPNSSFRGSRQSSPMRRSAHVSWSIGTAPLWGKDTRFRSIAAYTDVLNTHREEENRDLALARDDGAARFVHHLNRVLPDRLDKHATSQDEAVPRSTWSPTRTRTSPPKSRADYHHRSSHHQHQPSNVQTPPILFRNMLGYYVGLAWDGWRLQDQHAARNAQLSGGASGMTPMETRGRCGLLITGPPGSGKTTTMGVVVRDLILPEICNLVRFNQHVKEQSQTHRGNLDDAALLVPPFLLPLSIKKLLPADSNPTATVIQLTLDEGTEKWMPSKLWSREAFATFDAELFASRFIHEAVDCLIREPGYGGDSDTPVDSSSSRAFSGQLPNRRLELDSASNSHNSSLLAQGRHATHVDLCQQLTTVLRRAVTSSSEFQRMDSTSNIVFLRNDRSFLQQYLERSVAAVYIRNGVALNTDKIETEARHILGEWVLVMAELQSALGNLASVVRGEKAKAETGSRRSSPISRPPPPIPVRSHSRSEVSQGGPPHVPQGRPPPRTSPGRPPIPPHTRVAESIDVTRMGDSFEASTSLPTVDDIRSRRRPTTPADALREVINVLFGPLLDLIIAEAHRQQHPRQASKGVVPSVLVLCDDIDSLYATGHTSVIGDALVAQFTSVSGGAIANTSLPSLSTQLGSSRMLIGSWTDRRNNVLRREEDGTSRRTTPHRRGTPNRASTPHGWGIPSAAHAHEAPSLPLGRPASTPRMSPQAPGVGNQLVTVFNMLGAVPLVDLATEYPTLPSQMVCRPTAATEDPSTSMDPMLDRKSLLSGLSINSTSMAGANFGKQQPYPLILNDGSEVFDVSMFKGAPGYLCKYAELAAVLMSRSGDDKDDFLTSYLEQDNAHLAEIRQPHGSRPARLLSPTCALEVRHVGVHRILQSLAKLVGADGRVSVDTLDNELAHLYDY